MGDQALPQPAEEEARRAIKGLILRPYTTNVL